MTGFLSGCVEAPSHVSQSQVLPPSPLAMPEAAQAIVEGNRLFEERQFTAAMGKYERAVQAQPQLPEAHYNLALTLYRKGFIAEARPHFIEAANLAPGHSVIWNAPPFRKYGTIEPETSEQVSDGHFGHRH